MKTPNDRNEFVEKLLARDAPPPDGLQQHQDLLFRKIKRRIVLYKVTVGTTEAVLFLFALWASWQQERADDVARSLLWGSVSTYILLWFLVWFLRGIYRGLARLAETDAAEAEKWRRQDRLITTVAIVVWAFNSFFLYRLSSLTDPLQAAHHATFTFWLTVFFLLWYALGTASLVGRIWLEHKKMELQLRASERHD